MTKEKPIAQSRLQVETDLNALTEVLQWFEQLTLPLLPYEIWWQSQVALTEGFTNVIRHAHSSLPPTTPIQIEVKVYISYLEMRIWDYGKPFNLQAKLQSKLQLVGQKDFDPLENEGGRGLIFMQQFTDELNYTRMPDERNCLLMRRRIR